MSNFSLVQCDDKPAWNDFVMSSQQANIFCRSQFLDSMGVSYRLLLLEDKGSPVLGAVVILKNGIPIKAPHSYTQYQGILFSKSYSSLAPHKRIKYGLEAVGFLLAELEREYDHISFCLHHSIEDLRAFSWFHYHEPTLGRFAIDLRYTGLLDITGLNDLETFLPSVRKWRRYEYKQARIQGFRIEESSDLNKLIHLLQLTFQRQGVALPEGELKMVSSISSAALEGGYGKLLLCREPKGDIASAILFLLDPHCAYYWIGANDPEYRSTPSGTFCLLESIRLCLARGISKIDFVGINSPNRGDFKTSFNALPVPFFVVDWVGRAKVN